MQRTGETTDPILVVGAGPVGLMCALWLTRLGQPVRIIDRRSGGSEHSKALAMHANTLELMQRVGTTDALLEAGAPMSEVIFSTSRGKDLADVRFDRIDSPFNYVLIIEQSQTERVLREELARAGVEVEWNAELVSLSPFDGGCRCELANGGVAHHPWVIGCDGGPSTVRNQLGIEFEGEKRGTWFVLADVKLDWDEKPGVARGFLGPDGPLLFFPLPERPWYRIVAAMLDADPEQRPELSDVLFENLVIDRYLPRCRLIEYRWQSAFQVRRRLASRYRRGRVFLAGDAAHTHSPIGGQGMNTGLADASNLCWKLDRVIRGLADESLLDTYESERRPAAKDTLRATQLATDLGATQSGILGGIRDLLISVGASIEDIRSKAARRASMTEFTYRGPQFGEAPIVLRDTELVTHFETDTPSVVQRLVFADAAKPGHRAPDVLLQPKILAKRGRHLFDEAGPRHILLLFDGLGPTPQGYEKFAVGCEELAKAHPWIEPWVVTPDTAPEALRAHAKIVRDPKLAAHHRYGATSEAGYLVRPDNYVAWRAQPMDFDALREFLAR